ncbi:MAG: class I SAM-dependent methyltransferase [Candidatus Nanopelagicales bacterium]
MVIVTEPSPGRPTVGFARIDPGEVDASSRRYWEQDAEGYQAAHGQFLGGDSGAGFVWGPEGVTEDELEMLGPAQSWAGRRAVEIGCGGGQCGRWLAERGAAVVGVDIALNQLRFARAGRYPLPVVAATGTALPFADASFDLAFASYGAVPFVGDLPLLFAEVQRVLRPSGIWVYSTSHPIRWAFPDDPGPAGLTATLSYFDRTPYVERDETGRATYSEFHRTLADHLNVLIESGFAIERVVEPEWPEWNEQVWGGWSPLRGDALPGTLIIRARARGADGSVMAH